MRLVNFDFMSREGISSGSLKSGSVLLRMCKFRQGYPLEDILKRKRGRKRVNKVFVSRGGIRL